MSEITVEHCKSFIVTQFPATIASGWKCIRRYQDENGVWLRDFIHNDQPNVCVVGFIDNTLSIVNSFEKPVLDSSKNIPVQKFKRSDISKAKKIIDNYLSIEDKYFVADSSLSGYKAVPNLIEFNFNVSGKEKSDFYPVDSTLDDVVEGVIVSLYIKGTSEIPKTINNLICDVMPPCFYEVAFGKFEHRPLKKEPKTLKEIAVLFSSYGFVYKANKVDNVCPFKSIFKEIKFIPFLAIEDSIEVEIDYVQEAIKLIDQDDEDGLINLKFSGMPSNLMIGDDTLLGYMVLKDKPKCFKLFLGYYLDTVLAPNNQLNTVWKHAFERQHDSGFDYVLALLEGHNYYFYNTTEEANALLFKILIHNNFEHFKKYRIKMDPVELTLCALQHCITDEKLYNIKYFKQLADTAIIEHSDILLTRPSFLEKLENGLVPQSFIDVFMGLPNFTDHASLFKKYTSNNLATL